MLNHELNKVVKHWSYIAPIINRPKNSKEFNKLVERLDELLIMVGKNENHYLMGLIDIVSHFIEEYENEYYRDVKMKSTGIEALKYLMVSNGLHQSDLPEIGSQGIVSEILNGKRNLNIKQIKALSKKFKVDPSTFID